MARVELMPFPILCVDKTFLVTRTKGGWLASLSLTLGGGTTINLQISGTACAAPEIATGEARASGATCVRNLIGAWTGLVACLCGPEANLIYH